jgi:hypothetical protein
VRGSRLLAGLVQVSTPVPMISENTMNVVSRINPQRARIVIKKKKENRRGDRPVALALDRHVADLDDDFIETAE